MKYFFFIFIVLFLKSCGGDKEELVDIDAFLKQGKKVELINDNDLFKQNINKINKISINQFKEYKNWSQTHYNNSNTVYPVNIELQKKTRSVSGNFQNIIIYENNVITIDGKSNLIIYSTDLKKIKSIKIYNRKVYKNYNLTFNLVGYKNNILLSDNLGNIHSFDLKTLKKNWSVELGVPFRSNMKIYKDNVYLINSNSKIFSISTNDGKLNWSFETASKSLKDNSSYQIAIENDKLFFTNDSAEIYCLDLIKNNIIWSLVFDLQSFQKAPLIFKSSPISIDKNKNLYVSTNYGYTYRIDTNTGTIIWSTPIISLSRLQFHENYLLTAFNNRLIIYKKNNGEVVLNKELSRIKKKDEDLNFQSLIVGKNAIYLFDKSGIFVEIKNSNLDEITQKKTFKGFKDYAIYKNQFFLLSENSINKF
jgi:outer membrane protein assembly factor BamB